jgi:hypothetical protein
MPFSALTIMYVDMRRDRRAAETRRQNWQKACSGAEVHCAYSMWSLCGAGMEFTCILTMVSLHDDLDFRVHASARLSVHRSPFVTTYM